MRAAASAHRVRRLLLRETRTSCGFFFRRSLLLAGVAAGAWAIASRGAAAEPVNPVPAPLAWQVYLLLERDCAGCHGGHLAKPKGKFGYVLDLPRLAREKYVHPHDPEKSDLYQALVSTDEDEKMPPPDSDGPKPTEAEIALIRTWIANGAVVDEAAAPPSEAAGTTTTPPRAESHPLAQKLGRLHPLLVHFPIALLLCAAVTELTSRVLRAHRSGLQGATRSVLWLAALGAIVTAGTGWLNAAHEGYAPGDATVHRWLGVSTAACAVLALVISEWCERAQVRNPGRASRGFLLFVLLAAAVVVSLTGHTGGLLAYGKDYLGIWW